MIGFLVITCVNMLNKKLGKNQKHYQVLKKYNNNNN